MILKNKTGWAKSDKFQYFLTCVHEFYRVVFYLKDKKELKRKSYVVCENPVKKLDFRKSFVIFDINYILKSVFFSRDFSANFNVPT